MLYGATFLKGFLQKRQKPSVTAEQSIKSPFLYKLWWSTHSWSIATTRKQKIMAAIKITTQNKKKKFFTASFHRQLASILIQCLWEHLEMTPKLMTVSSISTVWCLNMRRNKQQLMIWKLLAVTLLVLVLIFTY